MFDRTKMPPLAIAFDTGVFQMCRYEKDYWHSTGRKMWGPHEIDTGYLAIGQRASFEDEKNPNKEEYPYTYAICESIRRKECELFELPAVTLEKSKAYARHNPTPWEGSMLHGITPSQIISFCDRAQYLIMTKMEGFDLSPGEDCGLYTNITDEKILTEMIGKHRNDLLHLLC